MTPKFSIVIPANNEENYLPKTLESINNQNYKDYEVIVVANGCTDKTVEVVTNLINDFGFPNLRLLRLEAANVSRARNYGASKSQGEVVIFLDADTTLEPDSLQKINQNFTEEFSSATAKVRPDDDRFKFKFAMWFKNTYRKLGFSYSCGGMLACRRNFFEAVNGYDHTVVVMEHKGLLNKLRSYGDHCYVDTYTTTSMRRLNEWGLLKVAWFWVKQGVKDKLGWKKNDYSRVR
ncbi:MAG TPA: glycosyltransferase family A protein [Candidatus Nanoarchaeia archaeon]|nr:glycosyltransferase family A protein [Candidatus Nanoarchaeia archaeon]